MEKRFLFASLFHETHTFLEGTTSLRDFQIFRGEELLRCDGDSSPLGGALECAREFGWQVLPAIDSAQSDDVIVCGASGSMRSGIWGELLSSAAKNVGCAGVVIHGAVRDVEKMRAMNFPVYVSGKSPYDSRNRQRVFDYDVTIAMDGVHIEPGDLIAADEDGMVVVPQSVENQVVQLAWDKVHAENRVRDAVVGGMSATKAFHTFGVL